MISLWVHSLLPLLLFLFDIRLSPEQQDEVEVFTTDAVLLTANSSEFCARLLESSSMSLYEISFPFSSNARLFSSTLERKIDGKSRSGHWEMLYFFVTSLCCWHWLNCFARKGYSHRRRLFFFQIILPEIRTGSLSNNSGVLVQ